MGRVVLAVFHLQGIALDSGQRVDNLRHDERVGCIGAQLLFPYVELHVLGSLDEISGLCRRDDLCLGKSLVDDVETEVVVGIVIRHEDILQILLHVLDLLHNLFSILFLKLCVNERSVLLTIDDGGGHREDG